MSGAMERLHEWDMATRWEPSNNDLGPTPPDFDDYPPIWDTEREWVYPHPLMEGHTCSKGWRHVAYQRRPVESVL